MSEGTTLSYQEYWGSSERQDLLPPRKIEIKHTDEGGNIPFEVNLDAEEVKNFMHLEGVRDGKALTIIFRNNKGAMARGAELFKTINNPPKTTVKERINQIYQMVKNGISGGFCRSNNQEIQTSINLGSLYDMAVLTSPHSVEQIENKFKHLVAEVLSHEVGHARQPKGIKGGNADTLLKVVGGTFALIDTGRRFVLPWLGLAEPLAMFAEGIVAETAAKKLYYNKTPGEKFAKEYSSSAAKSWADMLKIKLKDPKQLQEDYFWDVIKNRS